MVIKSPIREVKIVKSHKQQHRFQ